MKQNKWKNLGEKVDNLLYNNVNPSLRHFSIVSERLGISTICSQRAWNIYKGYIKESKHKIEHPKRDKLEEIDKYISKEPDIILEGNIISLTEQIKQLLEEK